nr:immunoglobulin heavy chain junction region [Macaca mulatta]MOV53848.1 immunoglobulin heavy chain junction region [Macaca mulatta]MOV53911.1 immunoglobulin heavy chain junction region [Macaca mulatta]MOV53920.1 immunoglobulin heavy chain junction region [Macaca mulatta]MOV54002.1 immunoglobulin heavy chain junction region [Macaca mulatta]
CARAYDYDSGYSPILFDVW